MGIYYEDLYPLVKPLHNVSDDMYCVYSERNAMSSILTTKEINKIAPRQQSLRKRSPPRETCTLRTLQNRSCATPRPRPHTSRGPLYRTTRPATSSFPPSTHTAPSPLHLSTFRLRSRAPPPLRFPTPRASTAGTASHSSPGRCRRVRAGAGSSAQSPQTWCPSQPSGAP